MKNEVLLKFQKEYQEEIDFCKSCIITRIENSSLDEESRVINLKYPYCLEVLLNDTENTIDHSYDLGTMNSYLRALSDINYLLAYEK